MVVVVVVVVVVFVVSVVVVVDFLLPHTTIQFWISLLVLLCPEVLM